MAKSQCCQTRETGVGCALIMIPSGVIYNPPWLELRELGDFIDLLRKAGATVRLVGGSVREALLGHSHPDSDIDLAIDITPDELIAKCFELGIQVIPTGIRFGTVTCILGSKPYEVTSLRQDIATNGRKAVVKYTKDWEQDAQRRDFTFNALYADWEGAYYDPTGQGIDDLKQQTIRFIGDAQQRIREDYLRIIRFFRFMALFQSPNYDDETLNTCIKESKNLESISPDRKWSELQKVFKSGYPLRSIAALISGNIMPLVCKINWSLNKLEKSLTWTQYFSKDPFYSLLGAVNHFSVDRNICIPITLQKRLQEVLDAPFTPPLDLKNLYGAGRSIYKDSVIRCYITQHTYSPATAQQLDATLQEIDGWLIPKFPVSGVDLQDLGFTPGPLMGRILLITEKWWVNNDFQPSYVECINYIQQLHLQELKDNL